MLQFTIIIIILVIGCDCNDIGSINEDCDQIDGQCKCINNVSGRTCDRCKPGYWGLKANNKCIECDCCMEGTIASQCDQVRISFSKI